MKAIELTPVSWVQKKSNLVARENRARKYSAARRRKETIVCECVWAFFIIGFFVIGMVL